MSQERRQDHPRGVRSFVIREGRFTPSQRRNLERHWARFGFEAGDDITTAFGREAPLVVEVGFGMGDSLFETARDDSACNFLGVEVHRPGVGHLLGLAGEAALTNLRVAAADINNVLNGLPRCSVSRVQVFFPDPWPKKRHHKRRLIQPVFVAAVIKRLKPGGVLHVVTDWAPYAVSIGRVLQGFDKLKAVAAPGRVATKYEQRGLRLGHSITEFAFALDHVPPPASADR